MKLKLLISLQEQIRTIKTESQWPFEDKDSSKEKQFDLPPNSSDEEEDLVQNPNRQQQTFPEEEEEESSDEDSQ